MEKAGTVIATGTQLGLDLEIIAEKEIDGVGMGVLNDGTPFLSLRGLARMTGVDNANLVRITEEWVEATPKPRVSRIKELIREQGYDDTTAFIAIERKGTLVHAVPDAVCMAVLEYYAFEAQDTKEQARKSFRALAKKGLRDFIYAQVGYNPTGSIDVAWKQFHDRVSLTHHAVPPGYFCVFKEIAGMFVTMIKGGVNPGTNFIPDISVGVHWANFWRKENLDIVHGNRKQFSHNYPDYFPQAASNPQDIYCYPDDALGDFRRWLREVYIPMKLPDYLGSKVKQGAFPAKLATNALAAFQPKQIPASQA
jgi:hypothetical protein